MMHNEIWSKEFWGHPQGQSVTETMEAIQNLTFADAILAVKYKTRRLPMTEKMTKLFYCIHNRSIRMERKSSSLCQPQTHLSLSNYWKYTGKMLLNNLNVHLLQVGLIPECQCGFRKDRGTIGMLFTAKQIQEKCQEQNVDLYMTFVDLTKAFVDLTQSVVMGFE